MPEKTESSPAPGFVKQLPPGLKELPGGTWGAVAREIQRAARELLADNGVTQRQLADALDMSTSGVSQMLNSRPGGLTVVEVLRIERLCEVPPGTLLDRLNLGLPRDLPDVLEDLGLTPHQIELVVLLVAEIRRDK